MSTCRMRAGAWVAVAAAFLAVGGCGNDGPLGLDDSIPPPVRDTTDPTVLVLAHAEALSAMDLDRYAALLERPVGRADVGFEYILRDEDVVQFRWIPEGGWNYTIEMGIMAHMMDPEFSGAEIGSSIESIDANLTVITVKSIVGGGAEVVCNAHITVLWGENLGIANAVRFLITMFPDDDGFLRIRTIQEQSAFGARREDPSWAGVKALFR